MENKFFKFFRNKPVVIISAVLFVLLAAAGVAALLGVFGGGDVRDVTSTINSTSAQSGTVSLSDMTMKITALESDSLGVSPTSAFKLVFDSPPDESEITSSLKIVPEQSYKLKKVSRSEYSMTFDKPLEKDSIYRFTVSDKNTGAAQSWAFQTKKSLNVIRSLPRNKGVQVPINSGIEITFNAEKIENPEKYFEISPKTNGTFEQHGKTLVFVPEKLQESTIYTVTIKSGIGVKDSSEVLENDYTFSFQTIVPESNTDKNSYFSFSDSMYSFTPQAVPAMRIYADENMVNTEVALEIYSYPDADSFLKVLKSLDKTPSWAVFQNKTNKYDESKLGKAATVKARIVSYQKEYWNTTYLLLPASLPEGYYLVKSEINGHYYYTQLQINPASVYILAAKNKTLAWLNDSATGSPLDGAEVMLDNGTPVKSDKDGLAVLNDKLPETNDYQSFYFLIKPQNSNPFVAQVGGSPNQPYSSYYNNSGVVDDYWAYLYLDKGIYMPEDTVNAWGVIKPRDSSSTKKEAVLELIRYDYSTNGDENVSVLTSSKVDLSPNGTFTGSLRLTNYNPGSYEVRVRIGDKTFQTSYIQIMEYTKPAYKIDIIPDHNYMYAWETVNFDIHASFFEGTPVKGLKLNYDCSISGNTQLNKNAANSGSLVSNDSGASKVSLVPTTSDQGWRPQSLYLNVSNQEAEEQAISEYSTVTVFPKDTMVEVKTNMEGSNGKISISTSRINLEKLKDAAEGYYSEDQYRGAPVDMPLTAKLYEKHYEKKKTGDYYDYINKVKRDTFEYYEVQSLVSDYSFSTVNGKYEINYTNKNDKSYFIEVYGKDSKGRNIKETQYVYNWNYYSPYSGNTAYSIARTDYTKLYKEGENVPVEVKHSAQDAAATGSSIGSNGGRYLFIRMKNGILDYMVKSDPKYDFTFNKDYIPNMYVKALCFDGSNIYDAGIVQYNYDTGESKLDISVQADKEKYKPGDTVKLTFDVKDNKGKPSSSEVNVSIVDEAFFIISPQYVDTLSSLYSPAISSGIISDYLSYHPADEVGSSMAEGGEGGDMYVRKDFRDSALFLTVKSDSSGKAEVSFKLPDNLTSWRVTYQAVTEDLKAGSGKMNITSKLPFFVDTIFNKSFITGDSPSILVRANGTELAPAAEVNYTVVMTNEDGSSKAYNTTGRADTLAEIQLDALAAGNYTIRAEAVSGSLKDAMERSFKVSDSLLETSKTDYINLADSTVLSNSAKGLTSLVLYGEDSSLLYNELQDLYWSWGQRLDQKLANKIAGELLKTNFNETIYSDESFDIQNYQTEDGGLALLTYDSSNPALSAKLCSLAADYVDREALASYFNMLLNDSKTTPEDIAYAYWGLAALHEPVLLDIRNRLEAEDLTPKIKLILGTALSEIGDYQGARDIYENVMENSGKVEDTFAYVENGSRDESIDATAMCSLIALRINAPEKIKLFNYIKSNSTSELLVNLERLIFVKNYIKNASLDCSFNYELDGSKKSVDLKNGGYYRLTVTPEKLASLKFSSVKGKIVAASTYVAPVSEIRSGSGSTLSIQRMYEADGVKSATEFDRSCNIKVTITPKFSESAPDGFYEITDILPAGFRYVANSPGKENTDWYPDEVTGQKVVFGYYYNKVRFKNNSIVYFAKAVSPGTYTADNAAIRHVDSSLTGFTEKLKIKVKK
jgi:alpha-2-macroglobulin